MPQKCKGHAAARENAGSICPHLGSLPIFAPFKPSHVHSHLFGMFSGIPREIACSHRSCRLSSSLPLFRATDRRNFSTNGLRVAHPCFRCAACRSRWTMTDHEALQEARRRWGNDAAVHHHERAWYPFEVGQWISTGFRVWGQGDSWEEAFANADCQGRS